MTAIRGGAGRSPKQSWLISMKIAHLVGHSALNGVATSTKMLIEAQIKAGHEVMMVHPRNSWIGRQAFAGPLKKMESSFKTTPAELRKTGYPIRDWGRALVHAHGNRANKLAMIYTLVDGTPVVMTAHARRFQIPWRFAHAVVGLSQPTSDYYTSRFLVPRSRMHLVPNMFDLEGIQPVSDSSRAAARRKLGVRDDTLLLGAVGKIDTRKNQVDALRVLKRLLTMGRDAELLLVGDASEGDELPGWRDMLADPALAGRVHLAGHREDAVSLIPAMDIFLCVSRVEEAPIAPLEAMAQAVPVLSTEVGNMAELLPAERLFPVGGVDGMAQAVENLCGEATLRREAGAADRRIVAAKLSPDAILPRIEAIYRAALARSRDRGWKHFANPDDRWRPDRASNGHIDDRSVY
jgi:glycosyltransferase involved in cell wall biosynthesis